MNFISGTWKKLVIHENTKYKILAWKKNNFLQKKYKIISKNHRVDLKYREISSYIQEAQNIKQIGQENNPPCCIIVKPLDVQNN